MAMIESIFNTCIRVLTLISLSQCLYEDQIGMFDWRKTFVGSLKFASFDLKRVVVATHENALAAINLKSGQLYWRQLLEAPEEHSIELMHHETDVLTVSGNGSVFYVRRWDVNTGTLLSEWSFSLAESKPCRWVHSRDKLVHIVPVANSHLEVTHYDAKTGTNKGSTMRVSAPWIGDEDTCVLARTNFVCLSAPVSNATIYSIDTSGDMSKVRNHPLNKLIDDVNGHVELVEFTHPQPAVLVRRNGVHRLLLLGEAPKVLPYSLESSVINVASGDQNLLVQFERNGDGRMQLKSIDEAGVEKSIPVELRADSTPTLMAGICRGANCRILYRSADDTVGLLQLPSGQVQWQREEALAKVLAAELVELPLSELEASIEREFTAATSSDALSMFFKRISSQLRQLATYLDGSQQSAAQSLVRDVFGLHKLIVVATEVGKLYAIDTISGEVVWAQHVADVTPLRSSLDTPTYGMYLQRTARYAPHSPQMTLVGRRADGRSGITLYTFDPITGKQIDVVTKADFKLKQAMLLPHEDRTHLKALILLSDDDRVHIHPPIAGAAVVEHATSTFMFNVDAATGTVQGYALRHSAADAVHATETWRLQVSPAQIVAVGLRPADERVHSQGRVLADRSVFYKFVNPNLIALATIAGDSVHRHVLSVYLVDGVTGLVVHAAHHKRANAPVHMVHSENWLVYTYFSERFRRVEATAVELYEGVRQSNGTHFSSHALSQLPHAEALAYVLPVQPVAMAATRTERGIASKHVLIATTSGGVLEMPWAFLEPRGAHMANPEEGSIPYMPELPVQTESIINYNQTLARIRGIQVAAAKLESTCLVLVYGLDLFYTRVTPSKTFDVLKEDFDHWLIVMVLAGLTLASYASRKLSARKALKQMWK